MRVPASGAVLGEAEKSAMRAVVERGWLTAGPVNAALEEGLAEFVGAKHVRTCNSGSSANLLAVGALVEVGRLKAGDLVVTVAACFPTTVNALLVYGLVPVFVDVDSHSLNANADELWRVSRQAKGVMLAHTLGNPFDERIYAMCEERGLALVEDCCDALGATSGGKHVGTRGDLGTCSFFPAHHITTGEGGAVWTKDAALARKVESIRDWGRDCWCIPGDNNTCGVRFEQQFGELPYGYDHKTVTTALGFNLKLTDLQAACGVAQLAQVSGFIAARRKNFGFLRERLSGLADRVRFAEELPGAVASWFGFPITLKETGLRNQMQAYLAQEGVDTRLLFAGNITKQPYMKGRRFITASGLVNTDRIMHDTLWIGCHPQLSQEQLEYACVKIETFLGDF